MIGCAITNDRHKITQNNINDSVKKQGKREQKLFQMNNLTIHIYKSPIHR